MSKLRNAFPAARSTAAATAPVPSCARSSQVITVNPASRSSSSSRAWYMPPRMPIRVDLSGVDEALCRPANRRAVRVPLAEVLIDRVCVCVEEDQSQRAVGFGCGPQLRKQDAVVATERDRCDACGVKRAQSLRHLLVGAVGEPGGPPARRRSRSRRRGRRSPPAGRGCNRGATLESPPGSPWVRSGLRPGKLAPVSKGRPTKATSTSSRCTVCGSLRKVEMPAKRGVCAGSAGP